MKFSTSSISDLKSLDTMACYKKTTNGTLFACSFMSEKSI